MKNIKDFLISQFVFYSAESFDSSDKSIGLSPTFNARLISYGFMLMMLCGSVNAIGNLPAPLQTMLAVCCFTLALAGKAIETKTLSTFSLCGICLVAIFFCAFYFPIIMPLALRLIPIAAVFVLFPSPQLRWRMSFACLLIFMVMETVGWYPVVTQRYIDFHRGFSDIISAATVGGLFRAGPSAMAGWTLLICLVLVNTIHVSWLQRIICTTILMVFYSTMIIIVACLAKNGVLSHRLIFDVIAPLCSLLLIALTTGFMACDYPVARNLQWLAFFFDPKRNSATPLQVVGVMVVIIISCSRGQYMASLRPNLDELRVGLLTENSFVDQLKPNFDETGFLNVGMFGNLEDYLSALKMRYTLFTLDDINALEQFDILIVINPQHNWSAAELEKVDKFIEQGGGLWVLGDHTDILGTMNSLNRLLGSYGISFLFDSGYPNRPHWFQSLSFSTRLFGHRRINHRECSISIGATLKLSDSAYPVIHGTTGFSDWGNRQNEQGAFLGNYRYDYEERIGDVVLAAGYNRGQGRVLVFGDTSTLQNTALCSALPLVIESFAFLKSPTFYGPPTVVALVQFIGLLLVVQIGASCGPGAIVIAIALLSLPGIVADYRGEQLVDQKLRQFASMSNSIVIHGDSKHIANVYMGEQNDISGLIVTLLRNQYLPLVVSREFNSVRAAPAVVFLIGRASPLSHNDCDQILEYCVSVQRECR